MNDSIEVKIQVVWQDGKNEPWPSSQIVLAHTELRNLVLLDELGGQGVTFSACVLVIIFRL
jgi:hypothetical protein